MAEERIMLGDEIYAECENENSELVRVYMIVMDDTQSEHFYYGYAGADPKDRIIGIQRDRAIKTGQHFESVPLDYCHKEG